MTRNRKVDRAVLEREYIYDPNTPPVSFTNMADKYGLARNTVAEMGRKGRWYERRVEFRAQLGEKVVAALGDEWVEFETAARERLMQTALAYLDRYDKALTDGEVKVSTRDMLGMAGMLRTLLGDTAASPRGEEALHDPDTAQLSPAYFRNALTVIEQAERELDDGEAEPGPAGQAEATGTTGSGQD